MESIKAWCYVGVLKLLLHALINKSILNYAGICLPRLKTVNLMVIAENEIQSSLMMQSMFDMHRCHISTHYSGRLTLLVSLFYGHCGWSSHRMKLLAMMKHSWLETAF